MKWDIFTFYRPNGIRQNGIRQNGYKPFFSPPFPCSQGPSWVTLRTTVSYQQSTLEFPFENTMISYKLHFRFMLRTGMWDCQKHICVTFLDHTDSIPKCCIIINTSVRKRYNVIVSKTENSDLLVSDFCQCMRVLLCDNLFENLQIIIHAHFHNATVVI